MTESGDTGTRPTMAIVDISSKGTVEVEFSEDLFLVYNLTTINSTVLEIEVFLTDQDAEKKKHGFTWSVTKFSAR